ncbi:MAG: galactosyldiacylglycerol synthase [Caldilineaceae bacterium]
MEEELMYNVYDNDSGVLLGVISEEQLAFLRSQLEEESADDTDYYIMAPTVDLMAANGGDAALVSLLRGAIGTRDGVEIRFEVAPA